MEEKRDGLDDRHVHDFMAGRGNRNGWFCTKETAKRIELYCCYMHLNLLKIL